MTRCPLLALDLKAAILSLAAAAALGAAACTQGTTPVCDAGACGTVDDAQVLSDGSLPSEAGAGQGD
jgi:hypothetical protein